jgi:hypothetical protein
MDNVIRYRKTEKSKALGYLFFAMTAFALVIFALTDWNPICILVALLLVISWWLIGSLTIEITDRFLRIAFGPGLIRKRWSLGEIESVELALNPWWYGIGIHYTSHGWLYNVSLPNGIEVKLKSGTVFRIGSDEPSTLLDATRAAISNASQA